MEIHYISELQIIDYNYHPGSQGLAVYPFNIRKIPTNFSNKILRGPPVRGKPRHKLEVKKLLIIATEPV